VATVAAGRSVNAAQWWIGWATNLAVALVTSGIGYVIYRQLFNRQALKDEKKRQEQADKDQEQKDKDEESRRDRERRELLQAVQDRAQLTALSSYHDANDSLRVQCADCQSRLTATEKELRDCKAALRVIVRVLDKNDPAQIEEAITAARDLI
jgi:hypothetical protein